MFSAENIGLVVFVVLGLAARSNLVAAAASILLVIRLTHLSFLLHGIERRGVELGLLFLTLAMLVPFAQGKINYKEIVRGMFTVPGILALVGGAVATHLNGRGLHMITEQSHLMVSLIVGSIIGIVVWGGIPVGPLMAAGVTYVLLEVVTYISQWWH